jgi:hypothetical protein
MPGASASAAVQRLVPGGPTAVPLSELRQMQLSSRPARSRCAFLIALGSTGLDEPMRSRTASPNPVGCSSSVQSRAAFWPASNFG